MPIGTAVACSNAYSSYCSSCSRRVTITGKSKSHCPPPPSDKDPPRITSNVKQNLQILRSWKKSSTPRPSTSYRRKKPQKEQLAQDTTSDHLPYDHPSSSNTLYFTNQEEALVDADPVMLVDGYNVCGYWPKLKKHFLQGSLDVARHELVHELISFSTLREIKMVVVFDALMSGLPTHKETFSGIDIIFSGETCADAWIEKEVAALRQDGCPKVWVVTSDRCQQHAAHGAGAFVWSSKALVSEIKAAHEEVEYWLKEHRPTSFQGRLLKHNLDSKVVDALKDLRGKLAENEKLTRVKKNKQHSTDR